MRTAVALFVALAAAVASAAEPSVPVVLPHTGRLLDGSDQPVNGQLHVKFAIYPVSSDTDGTAPTPALWTSAYDVQVTSGVYSVNLGDPLKGTPFPTSLADGTGDRWLGVSIGDGQEMRPRLRLGSVPFAMLAQRALQADHATNADHALLSDEATHATNADHALLSDEAKHAAEADHASAADEAKHALNADAALNADHATAADKLGTQAPSDFHDAAQLTGTVPAASLGNALQNVTVSGGALTVAKSGTSTNVGLPQASASQAGYLSAQDYAAFVKTDDARLTNARAPTAGSTNYIQNGTGAQAANFNVTGDGTVGTNLNVGGTISGNGANVTNVNAAKLGNKSITDVYWTAINAAATGACAALDRSAGCCGHSVLAGDGVTACSTICASLSGSGRTGTCAGEVAVWVKSQNAAASKEVIGSYYNYSCNGTGGNARPAFNHDPNDGYFDFCCCDVN